MPGAKKNFIGLEGFIWWVGVVEDRQDPEQLGRVRVRCFGWHTEDKNKIPTDSLPWAHPVIPVNHPATYTPKEGDMVFGFFMDGDSAQRPMIIGVLPGKPEKKPNYQNGFSDPRTDLTSAPRKPDDSAEAYPKSKYLKEQTNSRLSRNKTDGTIVATRKKNLQKSIKSAGGVSWSEPPPAYATKYPYNNVLETESGHVFELDDTPNAERIQLAHRNGSYIEIDASGNRTERVQKDQYEVIMGSDYVYVAGKCSVTIGGDCNLKVAGKINIEAAEINMASEGNINIKGGGAVKIESGSTTDIKSGAALNLQGSGAVNIKGGGSVALTGSSVEITSPLNVSGETNLTVSGTTELSGGPSHLHSIVRQPVSGSGSTSASGASSTGLSITSGLIAVADAVSSVATIASGSMGAAIQSISGVIVDGALTGADVVAALSGGTDLGILNSTLGKVAGGLTSTISGVYNAVNVVSDGILQDFASNLPIGELTNNVGIYENIVNAQRGGILNLQEDLKYTLLGKIDEVSTSAIGKNIPFNLNGDLQNAIYDVKNITVSSMETKIGKHIYPSTETFYANTAS